MARGIEGNEISTPRPPPTLKSTTSSQSDKGKGQKSILGFFGKKPDADRIPTATTNGSVKPTLAKSSQSLRPSNSNPTPAPSSDAPEPPSSVPGSSWEASGKNKENGLPSPITPVSVSADGVRKEAPGKSSPSRKAKKPVSYAESESEDEDVLRQLSVNKTNGRATKRRKISIEESEDEFGVDAEMEEAMADGDDMDDMDHFIAPDDSDEDIRPQKRRRQPPTKTSKPSKAASPLPPPPPAENDDDMGTPTESTAQQWKYDPENPVTEYAAPKQNFTKKTTTGNKKEKAHKTAPEARHPWLADVRDADGHPSDHPDYDHRTLFIPDHSYNKLSDFEKQYWDIKKKFMDTIVFFKKGKFYELYEMDATIGHQLFDLKLTDRVNMRMVGVPESSLDMWANQFVAKGYKIARVDQMESALAKEMRERGEDFSQAKKKDKVIHRELASVLTAGTLTDGSMLQDDMAEYVVAVKETVSEIGFTFGVAFADCATSQFHITEFDDDADMTKFETLVAQVRPKELLLEKSCISAKALRILKNNTGPTTIWNYLKPGKEFWTADTACRELDASGYFIKEDDKSGAWPTALTEAREKELVMSAFGALVQYLRLLKIDRDTVTLGNISWYDPIRTATSLVLDGQSLINLEIFANTFDGGPDGTLFAMLNRCISPFGKRMLKQWVQHPLADAAKINARLDAVDALNADNIIMDRFTASLSKLPDLERLISRVHAGRCKVQEFVKVIEGFDQIEYTMSLLKQFGHGEGLLRQLLSAMPDLATPLKHWKDAFDKDTAKTHGLLVPKPGVEEDFDQSHDDIAETMVELDNYLHKQRKALGTPKIVYSDNGKEIKQLELPKNVKVPSSWSQMSATKAVTRYYTPELRKMVRRLQEAQETHSQIAKDVAGRFYARFDEDYNTWLAAIKIIAQLDCLISLAKASASLGEPSCRPTFIQSERAVLDFCDLRHPCMYNVPDFIPNDITLGGATPNIDLLTGANAAGKSTILRMTCVAVILAQIGCHLPCVSATLTPIDRIMSRLGANDNIFAAQSTFFVELAETKKILSEATPHSLVILDELGRGTSSYDGVAVAQAVLHHIATHVGCIGFFATHYHSLALEFAAHPEIRTVRMAIDVDEAERRVTFLFRLEDGVAEGSFGMHCASMCGIPRKVIERAEEAAREWEYTSRLKGSLERARGGSYVPLGLQSDVAWMLREGGGGLEERGLDVLLRAIKAL